MNDNPLSETGPSADHLMLVQREVRALLRYLADEFDKQLKFAEHELTQTQGLLNDAIQTLTACFTGIHDNIRMNRSLGDEPEVKDLTSERYDMGELAPLLNTAIRSLQFQDLTQQLIDHALHRVSAMREVMRDFKSVSANDEQDPICLIEEINRHRLSVEDKIANLDEHKTNPVSQGHMMTGEIELF